MNKTGVLLINVGTPTNCDTSSVRRYLKEFLSDPRVIDISPMLRWLLLHLLILPFRPKKSAQAYQQIWQTSGSPLLLHSQSLQAALATQLGKNYHVALGMRYGSPSMAAALNTLQGYKKLIILPLFPQYSSAATGSATAKTLTLLSKQWNVPQIKSLGDFYAQPGFTQAYTEVIKRHINGQTIDMLLFSYHGLPERHIHKSACTAACNHIERCPRITEQNQYCYRAQCYATSDALAKALGLSKTQYSVAFQSRLGRTPWIKPYTDELFNHLIQQNVRRIAVVCPSFVADCLETLEEIAIRGKAQWQALGGQTFITIPCLNAEPLWVSALAQMITDQAS